MGKIIRLTESDLVNIIKRVIKEQRISDLPLKSNSKYLRVTLSPEQQQQVKDITRGQKDLSKVYYDKPSDKSDDYKVDDHTLNTILAIGAGFIPVIGPFISAGIGLYDAASYYQEGDKKTAGLSAMFSLFPGATSLISKIPGAKELGEEGLSKLSLKLSKNLKLNKLENEVVKWISDNKNFVQKELSDVVSKTAKKAAETTTKNNTKQTLINIGKKGLDFTTKTAKKEVPKQAVGYAYTSAYDSFIPNN
jgi:hypothetical protein